MHSSICFIGAGNMAQSLIGGLIASGYDKQKISATDPTESQRNSVTQTFGIQCFADNAQAINQADIVVLAVKPQTLESVCESISDSVQTNTPLIISVAAGIRSDDINRWLGGQTAIVRTMPNTPALIQTGATGLFANSFVTTEQQSQAEHILRAAGITVWVDEEAKLDAVTALSGSGPAYYFLFMEAMEQTAQQLGLDEKTAHLLALQTALGSAKMALESHLDCATLRKNVTSPNGTTERAIQSFENAGLREIVENAMKAAQNRAVELADELGGKA
ncbi:pyrroline-5-carboxylate reductase [Thiomicrorhabdus lithotrophica]|uniref:Pyrroline-5-carboxylate reductase n=1 Tax=Thiomicrorhabdus lithotrophica TaxID=2949997 RepID=A0ABY8CC05_9GAMM|nr:pyrroline-5-carboxylate reductase [Thiomicrorhabdus lithotrophica]WEJ62332.1 pyrroline-5-carboxylate reductase [Thiomicrorhabdus lithotrophica]